MPDEYKAQQKNKLAQLLPTIMNAIGGGDPNTQRTLDAQSQKYEQSIQQQNVKNFMRSVMQPATGEVTPQLIMEQAQIFDVSPDIAQAALDKFQKHVAAKRGTREQSFKQLPGGGTLTRDLFADEAQAQGFTPGTFKAGPQPKLPQPFTLSPGQQRFGADNQQVASVPAALPKPKQLTPEQETFKTLTPEEQKKAVLGTPADTRTKEIKNFEFGLENPDFVVQQKDSASNKKDQENLSKNWKRSGELRKEFLAQSKEFIKVRDSFTRVKGSSDDPSPAGDLSLIFNYMKMLDPGSVVRESEFATAASTGAFGERMQAAASKIINGERLSDVMRADFVDKANVLFQGMNNQHKKREVTYTNISERNELPVADVVVSLSAPKGDIIEAPQSAIDFLKSNPEQRDAFKEYYGYLPEGL